MVIESASTQVPITIGTAASGACGDVTANEPEDRLMDRQTDRQGLIESRSTRLKIMKIHLAVPDIARCATNKIVSLLSEINLLISSLGFFPHKTSIPFSPGLCVYISSLQGVCTLQKIQKQIFCLGFTAQLCDFGV